MPVSHHCYYQRLTAVHSYCHSTLSPTMRRHIPTIFSPALSQDNNVPRPVPLLSSSSSSSVPCSPSGIPAWSLHAAVTAITTQIKSNPRLQHSCTTSLAGPPSIPASQYTDKQENSLQASRSKGSKQRGLVNKWIGFAIKMVSSNRCKVFRTSVWDFCLLKILKNFFWFLVKGAVVWGGAGRARRKSCSGCLMWRQREPTSWTAQIFYWETEWIFHSFILNCTFKGYE